TTPKPGSSITASGKIRVALMLPLSGRSAPIGQAMQQAAELSLFDTGAKELALASYDSGDSPDQAAQAYRKARTEGVALVLGPLSAAGVDNHSVQLIGTGVWDVPGIGSEALLRGAWYAAPDPARRADFERKFVATYGRPPPRLASLAYDALALAARLARIK